MAEASEEGHGSKWAIVPVMMMMVMMIQGHAYLPYEVG
jgi:hypothetical protein